jgi:hypothetical protein
LKLDDPRAKMTLPDSNATVLPQAKAPHSQLNYNQREAFRNLIRSYFEVL